MINITFRPLYSEDKDTGVRCIGDRRNAKLYGEEKNSLHRKRIEPHDPVFHPVALRLY
jgi:hypothetical protein